MPIHTDQGPPLHDDYMPVLQLLGQYMEDREATAIVYKLQPLIANMQDRHTLVMAIKAIRDGGPHAQAS
jgi:hypothetical protein